VVKVGRQGFSLLEILLVIALMSLLLAFLFYGTQQQARARRLKTCLDQVRAQAEALQALAFSRDCPVLIRFEPQGYSYSLLDDNGQEEILGTRDYPPGISGTTATIGFTAAGTAKYAGSVMIFAPGAGSYKLSLSPDIGKVTIKKVE
jgi:prepilin-type N-terminal cleavage/methylation domain-containing protein